ncbi:TolC family protein [Aeromonas sp. FDAARGOS 1409]|uniref:TolC family protein n=1 Tax=Aeromonas TaxID=642 RepID=UPI001C236B05|nr:TolC family protein [Aeromonas sp. FDAARGOS 1409]QXC29206.1 TolC family protein [Aeromonas sp. FDAARGOS 1409]
MTTFNQMKIGLVLVYFFLTSANAASLQQVLDHAWSAQNNKWRSEADSHLAEIELSQSWTPEPPKLEVSHTTDQVDTNHGRREWEVGVGIPLWLPGQRDNSINAAVVEQRAFQGRQAFEKWKLAGELREAWWETRFSEAEVASATKKLRLLERLTADTAKKLKAGEVAPLEVNQAKLAELDARKELALATAAYDRAIQAFQLISLGAELPDQAEELLQGSIEHPALVNAALESGAVSAQLKKTSNSVLGTPELGLSYTSERDAFDEPYSGTVKVGVTIPWGTGTQNRAQMAAINASLSQAKINQEQTSRAILMQQRIAANELQQAKNNADNAGIQVELAREKSAWVKKGYQKGQFDLAMYLKTLQEEWQSQSLLIRSRLEVARAISRSNQAAGVN